MHSNSPIASLELYLPRTPIMTGADTARILGYPTTEALYKAYHRGRLPIKLFKMPGRRGWFAPTAAVRQWLEESLRTDPPIIDG
jgi:hypothetical protein